MTPDHMIQKRFIPTSMELCVDNGTDEVDYRMFARGRPVPG
jgi:hypothetical protein